MKAGMMEQAEADIATQRRGKHSPAAMNQHATTQEMLEALFSVWSTPTLYIEDQLE
jgi:hypothetical protein